MANIKYFRRLMRSRLFFFISTGAPQAPAAAGHKIKVKPVQGLSNYTYNSMQGAPVTSVRASHYLCLPLQACHRRPSSLATQNSFADEGEYIIAHDDREEREEKQLARSHSCSKLQGKQQRVPSFNRHRVSSHSHSQSCRLHDFAAESSSSPTGESEYTRSWSAPSLYIGRHAIKLPLKARGFSSSGQSKDGSTRGKRAPKGHVAVYVQSGRERQVVPIAYLSHPHFQALLKRAESEFGFRQQGPGLRIPCSLSELHHTLHQISTH